MASRAAAVRDTLVIGLGNLLASDDGAGIEAARVLAAQRLPAGVRVVEAATTGLGLIDLMLGHRRVILVDALLCDAKPGTVLRLTEPDLSRQRQRPLSAHDLGVAEALMLGDMLYADKMPREVLLFGIVVERTDPFRTGLSPAVRDAIPEVVEAILAEIDQQ